VVVAAVNRGLADHHDLEFLMNEVRNVAKQLESASASASRQEKGQDESPERRGNPERPKRAARTRRPEAQTDVDVIEAEIISDDLGDPDAGGDADPEPREEDLGR
jgi:hypothetical protein